MIAQSVADSSVLTARVHEILLNGSAFVQVQGDGNMHFARVNSLADAAKMRDDGEAR